MESIWRIGGYGMKDSTMIRLTYGMMFLITIVFWWSAWNYGFFITLFYLISISFTLGVMLGYWEKKTRKDKLCQNKK